MDSKLSEMISNNYHGHDARRLGAAFGRNLPEGDPEAIRKTIADLIQLFVSRDEVDEEPLTDIAMTTWVEIRPHFLPR